MLARTRNLKREQLDRQMEPLRGAHLAAPPGGWIRTVREALGMNGRQLADRMGVAPSHRAQLEQREVAGTASLQSLRRAADALGCDVVYALVPKGGKRFEDLVHDRAREVAGRTLDDVGVTMALEAQPIDDAFREREIDRIANELATTLPRSLWD